MMRDSDPSSEKPAAAHRVTIADMCATLRRELNNNDDNFLQRAAQALISIRLVEKREEAPSGGLDSLYSDETLRDKLIKNLSEQNWLDVAILALMLVTRRIARGQPIK